LIKHSSLAEIKVASRFAVISVETSHTRCSNQYWTDLNTV